MPIKFIFLLLFSFILKGQTAEEIISKNLENTGGYSRWMSLHSLQLRGSISFGINEVYPIALYQKRPNLTMSIIQVEGKSFILEGYNGKKAYQNDFESGKIVPIENYTPESFDSDLLNYKNKGFKATYKGKENVNNQPCFVVELQKYKNWTTYYFSTENYYLLKEENENTSLHYGNFKTVDHYIFPFRIESITATGQSEFLLSIERIETNKVIDEAIFE